MTQEKAQELSSKYMESAKTLCVTSDGAVYIDNDIEYMKKHAETLGLKIFVFKGEKKAAEVKEVAEEKPTKKDKK